MKKSTSLLTFFLILFFLFECFTPQTTLARNYLQKTPSSLSMTTNQTRTIILNPNGEQSTVQLTLTYTYGRLARPQGFPFPNRKTPTTINISVTSQPNWCLMSFDRGSFEIPIQTFLLKKNLTTTMVANLTIQSIDQKARANQAQFIQFNVTAQQNGNVQPSHTMYNLSIAPDYLLVFNAYTGSSPFITMDYGTTTNTSVIVKNLGNCETTFHIQPQMPSTLLNISFDQQPNEMEFSLDINEQRNITISLQSDQIRNQDDDVSASFNVTAYATDAPLRKGTDQVVTLLIALKKPVKEDKTSFDGSIYLVYLAVLLIILPGGIILFYYQKKKNTSR